MQNNSSQTDSVPSQNLSNKQESPPTSQQDTTLQTSSARPRMKYMRKSVGVFCKKQSIQSQMKSRYSYQEILLGPRMQKQTFVPSLFKTQKSLPKIQFPSIRPLVAKELQKLKCLRELRIKGKEKNHNSGMEKLVQALVLMGKSVRKLRTLEVNVYRMGLLTNEAVNEIAVEIGKFFPKLEHFDLQFSEPPVQEMDGYQVLKDLAAQTIKNMNALQSLRIAFLEILFFPNEVMLGLAEITTLSSTLKRLEIFFPKFIQNQNEEITTLASKIFRNSTSLEHLRINLWSNSCKDSAGVHDLVIIKENQQEKTRKMIINFAGSNSNKKKLQNLASLLEEKSNELENLSLNFSMNNKTLDVLQSLATKEEMNFAQLRHLSFFFEIEPRNNFLHVLLNRGQFKNQTPFWDLLQLIGKSANTLQTFWLSLASDQTTDETIATLSQQIANNDNLKKIKDLKLDFSQRKITDVALQTLAETIANSLTSLHAINLNFKKCENLTDDGFHSLFMEMAKNLKNLRVLQIEFPPKITYSTVEALSMRFRFNLKKLERIKLSFDECKITSTDLWILTESLGVLNRTLRHLSLSFRACAKFSQTSVQHISKLITSKLHLLQSFQLNLNEIDLTNETIHQVRKLNSTYFRDWKYEEQL